jgi:hypothetical protein
MSPIAQYVKLRILESTFINPSYWEDRASTAGCLDIVRQKEFQLAKLLENVARKANQLKAGSNGRR